MLIGPTAPLPDHFTRAEVFAAMRVCVAAGQIPLRMFDQRFIVFGVPSIGEMFAVRRVLGYGPWRRTDATGFEFLVNVEDEP